MFIGQLLIENIFYFIHMFLNHPLYRTPYFFRSRMKAFLYRAGMVFTAGVTALTLTEFSSLSAAGGERERAASVEAVVKPEEEKREWLMLRAAPVPAVRAGSQKEAEETDNLAENLLSKEIKTGEEYTGNHYSDEDYQVLLKIVQAEAGDCDSTGKILVANVVLNRVKSEKFPDTIKDVVYEKAQFSPVANGAINRAKVSSSTADCVNRALNGEDYSRGALYFMNRRASRSDSAGWFDRKLTYLFQHESHEFFK